MTDAGQARGTGHARHCCHRTPEHSHAPYPHDAARKGGQVAWVFDGGGGEHAPLHERIAMWGEVAAGTQVVNVAHPPRWAAQLPPATRLRHLRTSIRLWSPASTTTSLLSSVGGGQAKGPGRDADARTARNSSTRGHAPVISAKKKMPVMRQYSDAKTRSSENWGSLRARALHAVR